jgi:hypothetical protein
MGEKDHETNGRQSSFSTEPVTELVDLRVGFFEYNQN